MPITLNVGPRAAAASAGAGGQTLGNAQGSITINVHNVTQANKILQESAKEMERAFADVGRAAQNDAKVRIAASRAAAAESIASSKQEIAQNRVKISAIAAAAAEQSRAAKQVASQQKQATQDQLNSTKVSTASAVAASKEQIAANKTQVSNLATVTAAHTASTRQQIASNRLQVSSVALTASQQAAAVKQQIQNARLVQTQQTSAIRTATAAQRQQHQGAIQGIQQQIAGQRLVVAGIAAQNAATRQTATAQRASIQQATAAQRQQHQTAMQAVQQQIAGHRLVVAGINAQNAAARQAAAAQRAAAQASLSSWQRFHQGLNQVRTEIFAIGATASLITGFGLQAAGNIQAATIQLKAMTGGVEEASELMDELQRKGRQAGIPFQQMLTFATQLLPVLEGNTEELLNWFDIVRRTAVLNQTPSVGGVAGATFSLREAFLSVQQGGRDFVSLADRFNISKKALQEALEISGGDFVKAMDLVLDRMGITTEMADEMAMSFNAGLVLARDGAYQLAAEGFGPLIQVLGPVLRTAAEFMGVVRGGIPGTLAFSAGLIAVTAGGSALLLVINQLTVAWTRLGLASQTAITRMGRIAALAGISVLGIDIGVQAGAALANRERRSQGLPERDLIYALFNGIAQIYKATQEVSRALMSFREAVWETVASLLRTMATLNEQLAQISPTPGMRQYFSDIAQSERVSADALDAEGSVRREEWQRFWDAAWDSLAGLGTRWGIEGLRGSGSSGGRDVPELDKRRDAILEWAEAVEKVERDTNRERIRAAIEYGRQVNEVNFSYYQNLTREAEDFARSRLRQEQDYMRQIQEVHEESLRRETEWREDLADTIADLTEDFQRNQRERQEDHDEKIADIKEDSSKKLLEIEEEYQEDREKALLDHRDKLLDAASRLDANAVFEEQRRFYRQQTERDKDHKERIQDERKKEKERLEDEERNFQKRRKREEEEFQRRLDKEQEGFAERLKEAKEADMRRLEDMEEAFQLQRDREDEDREIRLERAAEDHQRELERMQFAHDERMTEINRQEGEKLEVLKEKHEDELEKIGFFNRAKDKLEEDFYQRSLIRHAEYFKGWEEKEKALMDKTVNPAGVGRAQPSEFQSGGFVQRSGLALVHSGEYVINPQMTRTLRDMLNGGNAHTSLMTAANGGASRGNSVSFNGDVQVTIAGSTDMGEGKMYSVARKAFVDALSEVAGRQNLGVST